MFVLLCVHTGRGVRCVQHRPCRTFSCANNPALSRTGATQLLHSFRPLEGREGACAGELPRKDWEWGLDGQTHTPNGTTCSLHAIYLSHKQSAHTLARSARSQGKATLTGDPVAEPQGSPAAFLHRPRRGHHLPMPGRGRDARICGRAPSSPDSRYLSAGGRFASQRGRPGIRRAAFAPPRVFSSRRRRPTSLAGRICVSRSAGCISAVLSASVTLLESPHKTKRGKGREGKRGGGWERREAGLEPGEQRAIREALLLRWGRAGASERLSSKSWEASSLCLSLGGRDTRLQSLENRY